MNLALYARTLRYLRPQQIYGRIWFRAFRPRPDLRPAPAVRSGTGRWRVSAWRPTLMSSPTTLRILNTTASIGASADWEGASHSRLVRYNLHYFDDLTARESEQRAAWHTALVTRWIRETTAGRGTGWEPYPTSLRIVNWIKWMKADHVCTTAEWADSLAAQARWLSKRLETHLLGNHLWANAKALVFAGAFFSGEEAAGWLRVGSTLVERELHEQILPDGGHFERSPMYHAIVLEDVLDLINLAHEYPACVSDVLIGRLTTAAAAMLRWLQVMSHPDGRISFFNDAAFGVAPAFADLAAYARMLDVRFDSSTLGSIATLPDSGYVRLSNARAVVICDVGPIGPDYLPAHAHADTLSFELSVDGRRTLVNSGCSTYDLSSERDRQRGTAAHNAVVVDGENSSEVWGSFRVARRARALGVTWGSAGGTLLVRASHDGYQRLAGRVMVSRAWRLDPDRLVVDDVIDGRFQSASARWHLHPDVTASVDTPGQVCLRNGDRTMVLSMSPAGAVDFESTSWHPEFNATAPNTTVAVRLAGPSLSTRLTW